MQCAGPLRTWGQGQNQGLFGGTRHLHGEEFGLLALRRLEDGVHPLPRVRVRLELLEHALCCRPLRRADSCSSDTEAPYSSAHGVKERGRAARTRIGQQQPCQKRKLRGASGQRSRGMRAIVKARPATPDSSSDIGTCPLVVKGVALESASKTLRQGVAVVTAARPERGRVPQRRWGVASS